jgi:hypothetical protein
MRLLFYKTIYFLNYLLNKTRNFFTVPAPPSSLVETKKHQLKDGNFNIRNALFCFHMFSESNLKIVANLLPNSLRTAPINISYILYWKVTMDSSMYYLKMISVE